MQLLAVIVNYRTPDLTLEALAALMRELESFPEARVSVVENGSGDGSYERIQRAVAAAPWRERVTVLGSTVNGGFGAGCNLAIRQSLRSKTPPDFLYLLNSDAFPRPGCVARLVDCLASRPEAGFAASAIERPDGSEWAPAFRFPSVWSELDSALGIGLVTRLLARHAIAHPLPRGLSGPPVRVDWVGAVSVLIRREVFARVGLFDEDFFLYFEETDLCRRASAAGFRCWIVPESRVGHVGGASTKRWQAGERVPDYWFASRRRYFTKHHGRAILRIANLSFGVGLALFQLRRRLQRRPDPHPPHFLSDFVRYNFGRR
jgi:GT2 family glycosyltransferase